ncbi:MAG: pyridoxamine 5'-phosphate oxidase family protein [Vallitaleaceae bacterium]|nr:pyridoxamine 5'-phosphate oxidase family protein [Vallitaleaceae bacterium]
MRRNEKEVIDIIEIEKMLNKADICRLGLSVNNEPYVVPMNFGYKDNCLYLHSAKEGMKIEMMKANPRVCFEVEVDAELVDGGEVACEWGMKFISVIGHGQASIIEERTEKKEALDILMSQYSKRTEFEYQDKHLDAVAVIEIKIDELSCKKSGY